jgi:hypothetical protein
VNKHKKNPAEAGKRLRLAWDLCTLKLLQLADEFFRIAVGCLAVVDLNPKRLGQIKTENSHDGFGINLVFVSGQINWEMIVVSQRDKLLYSFDTG